MCNSLQNGRTKTLFLAVMLSTSGVVMAQDAKLEQLGKANRNFGMDAAAFQQHFGAALRRPTATPSVTVEDLADQVSEIRVFLTPEANTVVGEMVGNRGQTTDMSNGKRHGATREIKGARVELS